MPHAVINAALCPTLNAFSHMCSDAECAHWDFPSPPLVLLFQYSLSLSFVTREPCCMLKNAPKTFWCHKTKRIITMEKAHMALYVRFIRSSAGFHDPGGLLVFNCRPC